MKEIEKLDKPDSNLEDFISNTLKILEMEEDQTTKLENQILKFKDNLQYESQINNLFKKIN